MSTFEKAGECLYRNPSSGTYFARVKHRGKEVRRTLDTKNLAVARRKLKDFKRDIERLDPEVERITLKDLADLFKRQFSTSRPIRSPTRPAS